MAFFANAHGSAIEGGVFANVMHGDAHFHSHFGSAKSGQRGLEILYQNVASGAFHDAAERVDPPKCHPQTRMAILAEIMEWVKDPELRRKFIMWLYGPAGSGKSAIAQTIAEMCAKEGLLAASFFFSRTAAGRSDSTRFMASIAYQLSLSIPQIRDPISAAVEQDPLIFSRALASQMQTLIVKPLNEAVVDSMDHTLIQARPKFIIVDGLDECGEAINQKELLDALAESVSRLRLPLIFLIASRPEYAIRQAFNKDPLRSLMQGLALDENYQPDEDIRTYLRSKFDDIKEFHPSGRGLPLEWPTVEDMKYLIEKSSGQFIYASTVIKYIDSPRHNPAKRLKIILGLSSPGKDTPFAQLDALYRLILTSVEDVHEVLEILTLLVLQQDYSNVLTVQLVEALLSYDDGDVVTALTDMYALVHVPLPGDHDRDGRLRIYHASLHDFLMDKSRSEDFFVDAKMGHANLARHFLRYFAETTKSKFDDFILSYLLNGFIKHCTESNLTEDLENDLATFDLSRFLPRLTLKTFYSTAWGEWFDGLAKQRSSRSLYSRLLTQFDDWICDQFERYPAIIKTCIPAACTIPGSYAVVYVPDIFDILTHTLPPSEASRVRRLDQDLFMFQEMSSMDFRDDVNGKPVLHRFFQDRSRAGVHFADGAKFAKLAEQIVQCLCPRHSEDRPLLEEVSRPYTPESSDSAWYSALKLSYANMEYFERILPEASKEPELAMLLRDRTLQYNGDDALVRGRERMAIASLEYIKRCNVPYLKHTHYLDRDQCIICESLPESERPAVAEPEMAPENPRAIPVREDRAPSADISSTPYLSQDGPLQNELTSPTNFPPQETHTPVFARIDATASAELTPVSIPTQVRTKKKTFWKRLWRHRK